MCMGKASPNKHTCDTGMRDRPGIHESPFGLVIFSDQREIFTTTHAVQITISLNHRYKSRS